MRIAPLLSLISVGVMAVSGFVLSQQGAAPDWPQFRGPNRDGVASAFDAPASWPDSLLQRWKVDVGIGHASPVLAGNRIYTFTRRGEREVLQAFDAATGKNIWQSGYDAPVSVAPAAKEHGAGPKSTPTFAEGRLFAVGMGGIITAVDASNGKILWQKPGPTVLPLYGTATSPLVDRGTVIVH